MSSESLSQSSLRLRVITQRLATTPTWQLPHIVPTLAAHFADCSKLLFVPTGEVLSNYGSESAVLLHKLKTQISALLQDKTEQAQYAAIVLIKSVLEAGGWSLLQGAGAWIRGLIGLLSVSCFKCS